MGYIYSVTLKSLAALFHCPLKVAVFFDLLKQPFNGNNVFQRRICCRLSGFLNSQKRILTSKCRLWVSAN